MRIRGFNYKYFAAYEFEDGQTPDFLQVDHGLPPFEAINIQKLIRGNLVFQDSKASDGIQVADLLASGLRRLLRGSFTDRKAVTEAIGPLTVQNAPGRSPIDLISFGDEEPVTLELTKDLHAISASSKAFIKRAGD